MLVLSKVKRNTALSENGVLMLCHIPTRHVHKHAPNNTKKVAWADIGIRANLPYAKGEKAVEGRVTDEAVDVRATLTVLANRRYQRSLIFIDTATSKTFPHTK